MNSKVILIFAKRLEGVNEITRLFMAKGFTVYAETNAADFFKVLRDRKPDRVLISLSVETSLHSYLYSYVRGRYHIPVFTFHEANGNGYHVNVSDENAPIYIRSRNSEDIFSQVGDYAIQAPTKNVLAELPMEIHVFFESIHSKLQKADKFFAAEKFDLYSLTVIGLEARCHLSVVIPHGENSPEFRKMFFDQVIFELEKAFEDKPKIEIYETQVDLKHVERMRSKYDFPLVGKMNNGELGLFARPLPAKDMVEFEWDESAKLFMIPVETWMCDGKLDFHIYIWMPSNKHRVLYVRRGQKLEMDQFARLIASGVSALGVMLGDIKIYQQRKQALDLEGSVSL